MVTKFPLLKLSFVRTFPSQIFTSDILHSLGAKLLTLWDPGAPVAAEVITIMDLWVLWGWQDKNIKIFYCESFWICLAQISCQILTWLFMELFNSFTFLTNIGKVISVRGQFLLRPVLSKLINKIFNWMIKFTKCQVTLVRWQFPFQNNSFYFLWGNKMI